MSDGGLAEIERKLASEPSTPVELLRRMWVVEPGLRELILANPNCPAELGSLADVPALPENPFLSAELDWVLAESSGVAVLGGHRLRLEKGGHGNALIKGHEKWERPPAERVLFGAAAVTGFTVDDKPFGRVSEHGGIYVLPDGLLVRGHDCDLGTGNMGRGTTYLVFFPPGQVGMERRVKAKMFGGEKYVDIRFFANTDGGKLRIRVGGILAADVAEMCAAFEKMRSDAGLSAVWESMGGGRQRLVP